MTDRRERQQQGRPLIDPSAAEDHDRELMKHQRMAQNREKRANLYLCFAQNKACKNDCMISGGNNDADDVRLRCRNGTPRSGLKVGGGDEDITTANSK